VLKSPTPPPEEPPSQFGELDRWLLKVCTDWRVYRAQQKINWARHELEHMWGTLPDVKLDLDTKPLQKMKDLEEFLGEFKPKTVLAARELLRVTIEIMAHKSIEPDSHMADGPVLDIVRNVTEALDWLKADLPLKSDSPAPIEAGET
jgi:hypothetical protein